MPIQWLQLPKLHRGSSAHMENVHAGGYGSKGKIQQNLGSIPLHKQAQGWDRTVSVGFEYHRLFSEAAFLTRASSRTSNGISARFSFSKRCYGHPSPPPVLLCCSGVLKIVKSSVNTKRTHLPAASSFSEAPRMKWSMTFSFHRKKRTVTGPWSWK